MATFEGILSARPVQFEPAPPHTFSRNFRAYKREPIPKPSSAAIKILCGQGRRAS
jgi:hypothetical protein